MFPRVLYLDDTRALELNWFGFGALQVRYRIGTVRRAHPIQKRVLLQIVRHFSEIGQPVHPSNPKCSRMLKEFADLVDQAPSSMAWQAMFNADLQEVARGYAGD